MALKLHVSSGSTARLPPLQRPSVRNAGLSLAQELISGSQRHFFQRNDDRNGAPSLPSSQTLLHPKKTEDRCYAGNVNVKDASWVDFLSTLLYASSLHQLYQNKTKAPSLSSPTPSLSRELQTGTHAGPKQISNSWLWLRIKL